ncbi:hypothetical protein PR048_015829 [Dryococelus australis]|uniref:Uncharacterized protein n=1 Tax=Dryococelus australis TaxID=614101 RepID=A0ABQ9HJ52_9NEOP|nr:hypothetical protein PR048_015829 [Dryococelus australis]
MANRVGHGSIQKSDVLLRKILPQLTLQIRVSCCMPKLPSNTAPKIIDWREMWEGRVRFSFLRSGVVLRCDVLGKGYTCEEGLNFLESGMVRPHARMSVVVLRCGCVGWRNKKCSQERPCQRGGWPTNLAFARVVTLLCAEQCANVPRNLRAWLCYHENHFPAFFLQHAGREKFIVTTGKFTLFSLSGIVFDGSSLSRQEITFETQEEKESSEGAKQLRLARSPPNTMIRALFPAWSRRIFVCRYRAGRCRSSADYLVWDLTSSGDDGRLRAPKSKVRHSEVDLSESTPECTPTVRRLENLADSFQLEELPPSSLSPPLPSSFDIDEIMEHSSELGSVQYAASDDPCGESCSPRHTELESLLETVLGSRIIDLSHFFKQMKPTFDHSKICTLGRYYLMK